MKILPVSRPLVLWKETFRRGSSITGVIFDWFDNRQMLNLFSGSRLNVRNLAAMAELAQAGCAGASSHSKLPGRSSNF